MAIPEWQMEGYERLRIEIVRAAVTDYKAALRRSAREGRKCDKEIALERFFLSGWGQALSGDNGQIIIDKCREDCRFVPSPKSRRKLSIETERAVCADYIKGMSIKELARKYEVATATIQRCIKQWI
jgi:hypothetical protein